METTFLREQLAIGDSFRLWMLFLAHCRQCWDVGIGVSLKHVSGFYLDVGSLDWEQRKCYDSSSSSHVFSPHWAMIYVSLVIFSWSTLADSCYCRLTSESLWWCCWLWLQWVGVASLALLLSTDKCCSCLLTLGSKGKGTQFFPSELTFLHFFPPQTKGKTMLGQNKDFKCTMVSSF